MLLTKHKKLRQLAAVAETGNLLLLKLLLKNPAKCREYPGMVFRDYMSLAGSGRWQSKDIFELIPLPAGTRIVLEHLPGAGINTPIDELAYLALLSRALEARKIFEIGTFRGRTALNFALNSPDDCQIWTLDLPAEDRDSAAGDYNNADARIMRASLTGIDYQGKDVAGKIRQLFGDSTRFDFSPYHDQMDIVFVDGAHHYAAVRSDTLAALRMARPGGYIVWHDFANYGDYNDVTRAVLDLLPGQNVVQLANTQLAIYQRAMNSVSSPPGHSGSDWR